MKQILRSAFAIVAFSAAMVSQPASAAPTEREIVVGLNDVYVPSGFDTASDVYVVANGIFPNGCYRWKRADVTHRDAFTHEVRSVASVSQGMCIMVLVPFTKEVQLGRFQAGKHLLRFLNGDGTYIEKSLNIAAE